MNHHRSIRRAVIASSYRFHPSVGKRKSDDVVIALSFLCHHRHHHRRTPTMADGRGLISRRYLATTATQPPSSPTKSVTKEKKKKDKKAKKKASLQQRLFPNKTFVSCLPGLEKVLSEELTALEIEHEEAMAANDGRGGITLKSPTTLFDIYRCHLFLGTASEIRLSCTTEPFRARTFPELRRRVKSFIPWKDTLLKNTTTGGKIQVLTKVTSNKSKLYHTSGISERILEEIYESIGDPDAMTRSDESNPEDSASSPMKVKLDIRVERDMFDISIVTSLNPLHRRGYRLETGKAPLREDIAYAMLWLSGWKPTYFTKIPESKDKKGNALFLDPFCGSGTIAIEAASMVKGLPPGRFLVPPLKGTMYFDEGAWRKVQTEYGDKKDDSNSIVQVIHASDRDKGVISATKRNAERAGVLDVMDIRHSAVVSNPVWETFQGNKSGTASLCVATNPPFGKRISGNKSTLDMLPLYQSLADLIRKCGQNCSSFSVLTNNRNLVARTGLKCKEMLKVSHGGKPAYVMRKK